MSTPPQPEIVCPNCGRRNLASNPRCFNCDARLEGAAAAPAAAGHVRCGACGETNAAARKFCRICGASLENAVPADAPAEPAPQPGPSAPGSELATFGWLLFAIGIAGMAWALTMGTTVDTDATYLLGQRIGGDSVHNVGLIATKLSILIAAGFATVAGAVLVAAGAQRETAALIRADAGNRGA